MRIAAALQKRQQKPQRLSIFQSNNDPEMRFRFQYKMILKSEWV